MIKEKFASQLAKELKSQGMKMNRDNAERFIADLAKSMSEGLARDRKLIVSNFGSFEVSRYGAKIIQSPRKDGKKFFMPPTDVVKWHPSGKIRERAGSVEVPEEEYRKLVGHQADEADLSATTVTDITAVAGGAETPAQSTIPYEVKIRIFDKQLYLTDDSSPLSKFVRAILKEMQTVGADKLEIVPEKLRTVLVYTTGDIIKNRRLLPRDSHAVVVRKIKSLAGPTNEFSFAGADRIKLAKALTPFGEQLTVQRIC